MGACSQGFGGQEESRKANVKVSLSIILKESFHLNSFAESLYSMCKFPAWNNLKHFNHISTISFTDGQSFYDILKVSHMSDSVHTPVHHAAASLKLTTHTLHSSLSMLLHNNWAAMHDKSAPQVS